MPDDGNRAVLRLKRLEITPFDLIDAAARRIAQVEPAIMVMGCHAEKDYQRIEELKAPLYRR